MEFRIVVADRASLADAIGDFTSRGFFMTHTADDGATLRKPASTSRAFILLGLIVYFIVKACARDEVVHIAVTGPAPTIITSDDGRWWWCSHRLQWIDMRAESPADAPLSDDGLLWWDGRSWHGVRRLASSGEPA